ncbi:MAG: SRPBCC domain-containing protein, partial [Pseudomonadota bacterium]
SSKNKAPQSLSFKKRVHLKVDQKYLWQALTKESELDKWWNKGMKLEPFVSGEFYEPWGKNQLATGKVLSVEPFSRIRFTWKEKTWTSGEETLCELRLIPENQGTTLIIDHSGWETFPVKTRETTFQGFQKGWDYYLGKLRKYIDKKGQ